MLKRCLVSGLIFLSVVLLTVGCVGPSAMPTPTPTPIPTPTLVPQNYAAVVSPPFPLDTT